LGTPAQETMGPKDSEKKVRKGLAADLIAV
jgi:hypothetical protein